MTCESLLSGRPIGDNEERIRLSPDIFGEPEGPKWIPVVGLLPVPVRAESTLDHPDPIVVHGQLGIWLKMLRRVKTLRTS